MTIKELKDLIKDLPDDTLIGGFTDDGVFYVRRAMEVETVDGIKFLRA